MDEQKEKNRTLSLQEKDVLEAKIIAEDQKIKKDFETVKTELQLTKEAINFAENVMQDAKNNPQNYLSARDKIAENFANCYAGLKHSANILGEYVGRTYPEYDDWMQRIYGRMSQKKHTKTDTKDLDFDFEKNGNVIHIISNFRCPHIRSVAYKHFELMNEIRQTFDTCATNKWSKAGEENDINVVEGAANKCIHSCYMVFVHHYIDKRIYRRDTDNYLEKPLSDAIANFFISGGDEPKNVRRMSMAIVDDTNFTEVFLVPFDEFPKWIGEFQQTIYENQLPELEQMGLHLFDDYL